MKIPKLAGEYINVYKPNGDIYPGPSSIELASGEFYSEWVPNDHCFIKDESGRWHAFGITHPLTTPSEIHEGENLLFHAIAPSLEFNALLKEDSWEELPKVLSPLDRPGEIPPIHAPWILKRNGIYHMVYGPTPIRYAVSEDLMNWEPKGILSGAPSGRDPQIFFWNNRYHLIVCGVYDVRIATSKDFETWTEHEPILKMEKGVDPESPFVIRHDNTFYLFVCGWDGVWDEKDIQGAYQHKTYVYQSDNPLQFENQIAILDAHAPEAFQGPSGDWFLSSVEWPHRGLNIARLTWE